MIFEMSPSDLANKLDEYLASCEFPQWGTSERCFTLKAMPREISPAGIVIFTLNTIAFDITQNDYVIDPKVNIPVIVLKVLSHPAGASLNVTNTNKRFDDFIRTAIKNIK